MKEIIEVLQKMGYREMTENVWGKPVGFHLFMYELLTHTFTNWFKSNNSDEILIWNSDVYEKDETVTDDFIRHLKYCESLTRTDTRTESNFEFLTMEENLNNLLTK